ncbi:MAG TPA: AzlD domain-containing protein [Casimicrobiaceae bacterium]|nr:AzlD domain-containing protein [Casimicrobiaceae bacterium]
MEASPLLIWSLILAVGAINFASRLSFIALFARREMPPLLARALRHVPVAMLSAIVVPAIVFVSPGILRVDAGNVKLIAALAAGVVAWRWRNTLLTIGVGMAALWLLQRVVS